MGLVRRFALCSARLCAAAALAWAGAGVRGHELMSEETFRQAGLAKLTAEELEVLDRWIASYTVDIIRVMLETKTAPAALPAQPVAAPPRAERPTGAGAVSPPAAVAAEPVSGEPAAVEAEATDFATLEGAWIVAGDGELLGRISRDRADPDSLANSFGTYGSRFIPRSILNTFGTYGNGVSPLSAFNPTATKPPVIMRNGELVAYLTKNTLLEPRVDPAELLAWVQADR